MGTAAPDLMALLTTSQAAARLQVSSQSVINYMQRGRLVYLETPYGRVLNPQSVEQLAAEREAARMARTAR